MGIWFHRVFAHNPKFKAGAFIPPPDPVNETQAQTGQLDLVHAPDTVRIDVEQFNRRVVTQEFNRVVCEALTKDIDPALPGKTLIFCATDSHADIVVDQLKIALEKEYGSVEDDAVCDSFLA